jgi:DNA-binding XRE family transcriptional regulator
MRGQRKLEFLEAVTRARARISRQAATTTVAADPSAAARPPAPVVTVESQLIPVRPQLIPVRAHFGQQFTKSFNFGVERPQIASAVWPDYAKIEWNDGPLGDFSRLLYVQKQRDYHAEGLVKKHRKPRLERELAAPINGRRWSLTDSYLDRVKRASQFYAYPSNKKFPKPPNYMQQAAPLRLVVNNPVVLAPFDPVAWWASIPPRPAPVSLLLPERQKRKYARELKPAGQEELFSAPNWRELTEHLGRTDEERAHVLGISRQQITAIRNGLFGPSADVARHILQLQLQAAA